MYDVDVLTVSQRRLVQTDVLLNIKSEYVEGKAYVACHMSARAKEEWVHRDDHFYCDLSQASGDSSTLGPLSPSALLLCQPCHAADLDSHVVEEHLRTRHQRLRALELFAGVSHLFAVSITLLNVLQVQEDSLQD